MIPVGLGAVGKKLGKLGYYKTGERMVAWLGGKNMGAVTQWLYPSGNLDWVTDFFFFRLIHQRIYSVGYENYCLGG